MRRSLSLLALAAALSTTPACSALFDPSQYRTTDAAGGGGLDAARPDGYVPPGVDADLDAPEPDAYVPPGEDAGTDAWAPDAWAPDAFVVPPTCPASNSLALPTCRTPSGLAYCSAEDDSVQVLPREVAQAMLPDARGYRLGLLGNAVEVVGVTRDGMRDAIIAHELVRAGDTLAVVWAESTGTGGLRRRRYTVDSMGLDDSDPVFPYDLAGLGSATITDISMEAGNPDGVWVGYTGGTVAGGVGTCSPSSGCRGTGFAMRPGAGPVWVAHAGSGVAGGYPQSPTAFQIEEIGGGMGSFGGGRSDATHVTGLRSTAGSLLYTAGNPASTQFAYELTDTTTIHQVNIGGDRARLTQAEGGFLQGQVRLAGDDTEVATAFGSCDPTCACAGCREPAPTEASVMGISGLIDWTFDNVDRYYRVATFLYGDLSGGTNVAVAMWSVEGSPPAPTLAPMIIGSGRVAGASVGVGRSLRTVVTRSPAGRRLEVFVATLVTLDGTSDRIYLSGFRLEWCSS